MDSARATPRGSSRSSPARGEPRDAGESHVTIVYFDCVAGASGDMILGSLIALGAPIEEIERRLRALPLSGFTIGAAEVKRHGFHALKLDVRAEETRSHRQFSEIRRILQEAGLPPRVLRRAPGA